MFRTTVDTDPRQNTLRLLLRSSHGSSFPLRTLTLVSTCPMR